MPLYHFFQDDTRSIFSRRPPPYTRFVCNFVFVVFHNDDAYAYQKIMPAPLLLRTFGPVPGESRRYGVDFLQETGRVARETKNDLTGSCE